MTGKLMAPLRETPATVPALVALALFVDWASDQAGYPVTHWAPGALIVLALLCIALAVVRIRPAEVPASVRIALAALAAYTAFSFLSILWAGVPGDAWEGANRTLLYLAVFALFAGWRQRGVTAALLLVVWVVGMIVLAAITALHIDAAGNAGLASMLPGGRLDYPSGYPNANAAQWLMAFWPALLLARSERLPWALRGLLAGGAVLLAEVALLSQSRGSLYATPVMVVLVFALLPGRVRTFALLVPVAAGIGAAAPTVLRVGDRLQNGNATHTTVHSATAGMFIAALAVALVVALGAAVEARPAAEALRRRLGRVIAGVAIATLLAGLAGGLAVAGNPVTRVESAWHSFKGGYGQNASGASRLVSGLGSNRYDFYRVALDEFIAHPIVGIGADNFQQQYLLHGRSTETPRYPHSVELRTLAETGLIGALLGLLGLAGALYATARAARGSDPLARSVAAAAAAGFAYWAVQGSFDWFWEFAGLGAPAFAMLGLCCALAPGRPTTISPSQNPAFKRMGIAVASLCVLVGSISLAAPWFSQLQIQSAARIWTKAPATAYRRLEDSANLNPLSDQAYLVAGDIALRFGDLARAEREFSLALKRSTGDAYATLEQGAIASSRGERNAAISLLERAVRLSPRDPLAQQTLRVVREGRRVDVAKLNREILLKAQQFA
ncbi:MAG TPA: O-antigen ligase family protein [Solirubrobacteraceae bacterium]|nr:O-antigen ligase family protein [Solirubrobacteraceae bacterium]